ncbi:MAG: AI-2E family transporter [Synechococcus sp.]
MTLPNWLALAALIAVSVLFWSLRQFLLLLFAGLVLAMALCTLVGSLRERRPMPRPLALVACLIGLISVLGITTAVVVPPFVDQFSLLLTKLPKAASTLIDLALGSLDRFSDSLYGAGSVPDLNQIKEGGLALIPDGATLASGVGTGLTSLLGIAGNLGSGTLQLLFVVAVALMISVQPESYRDVGLQLVPSFYRRRASQILHQIGDALSSWMVGVLISSLAVALLCGIALSLLGVKLVLANALIAGLLNVIPNVGPTISTVFPMAVALLDAPWKAAAVLGCYVLIQNIESYLITPSVMHHQVKLLPGLTLAAQFLFTVIFGPLGLLLALPMAVVLQVLIREIVIHDLLDPWKKQLPARRA